MITIKKIILFIDGKEYIVNDLTKTNNIMSNQTHNNKFKDYKSISGNYYGSSTCLNGGIVYDPNIEKYYKFKLDIVEEMSDDTSNNIVSCEVDFNDIMNINKNSKTNNVTLSDWPLLLKLEINNIEIIFSLRQLYHFNNEYQLCGIKYKNIT